MIWVDVIPSTGATVGCGGVGGGVSVGAEVGRGGSVDVTINGVAVDRTSRPILIAQPVDSRRSIRMGKLIREVTRIFYFEVTEKMFNGPYSKISSAFCRSRLDVSP